MLNIFLRIFFVQIPFSKPNENSTKIQEMQGIPNSKYISSYSFVFTPYRLLIEHQGDP